LGAVLLVFHNHNRHLIPVIPPRIDGPELGRLWLLFDIDDVAAPLLIVSFIPLKLAQVLVLVSRFQYQRQTQNWNGQAGPILVR